MVKMKYVGAAVLLSAVTLASYGAEAIPTFDSADIAGTTSIVKSGTENLKGIKGITGKVGQLNSIVGDAAGTLSRFQEEHGDDIQKAMEEAKKLKARKEKSKEEYDEHEEEVAERKATYQMLMDQVAEGNDDRVEASETEDGVVETATPKITSANKRYNAKTETLDTADEDDMAYDEMYDAAGAGEYEDDYAGGEDLDGSPADFAVMTENGMDGREASVRPMRQGFALPKAMHAEKAAAQLIKNDGENTVSDATAIRKMPAKALSADTATGQPKMLRQTGVQSQPAVMKTAPAALEAVPAEKAVPAVAPARKFRVSPQLEKISSVRSFSQTVAFAAELAEHADEEESAAAGNPAVGGKTVFPYALLCGGDAEEYVKDEAKQQECIDKLVRNNHAENHIEAAGNLADCNKMVYKTLISMLAETTNSKAKAATYNDTLKQQKEDSAQSTQLRDDLAVLGMSTYQTQLLLNEMSLNLSSQILLYTAQQVCLASKDVLEDKEETTAGGEK